MIGKDKYKIINWDEEDCYAVRKKTIIKKNTIVGSNINENEECWRKYE